MIRHIKLMVKHIVSITRYVGNIVITHCICGNENIMGNENAPINENISQNEIIQTNEVIQKKESIRTSEVQFNTKYIEKVDLHSHVLFDVDDGPKTIEDSIRLCEIYIQNGYSAVVATPHHVRGTKYMPSPELLRERKEALEQALQEKGMQLSIYCGMEVRLEEGIVEGLLNNKILSINDTRYVLVELPLSEFPSYTLDLMFRLQTEGYIPVLGHPERNPGVIEDISLARKLHENGVIMQINKGSILGEYGEQIMNTAKKLIREGIVDVISTDSHRAKGRNPSLENVEDILNNIVGTNNTELLMKKNPNAIINNNDVEPLKMTSFEPIKSKKKWPYVVGAIIIGIVMIVGTVNYIFVKKIDFALEKIMAEEVLKDPEFAKKLRRMPGSVVGKLNINDSNSAETGQFALDGRPINNGFTDGNGGNTMSNPFKKNDARTGNSGGESGEPSSGNEVDSTNASEKFTNSDRKRVMDIIKGAVPASELSRYNSMASDGLTAEETKQIKIGLKSYLSAGEIAELKMLYVKYENSKE